MMINKRERYVDLKQGNTSVSCKPRIHSNLCKSASIFLFEFFVFSQEQQQILSLIYVIS